jgi:ABC-2 type transport system permease protein
MMIWTVFQIAVRRLLHNRLELLLNFVVPAAFFSIFALIFGNGIGSGATPRVRVAAVDEVGTEESARFWKQLDSTAGLRFHNSIEPPIQLSRVDAEQLVQRGLVTAAIVLKPGTDPPDSAAVAWPAADLLVDTSDVVAPPIVEALVYRALAESWVASGPPQSSWPTGPEAVASWRSRTLEPVVRQAAAQSEDLEAQPVRSAAGTDYPGRELLGRSPDRVAEPPERSSYSAITATLTDQQATSPQVTIIDSLGQGKTNPLIAMYAAGIAVMFLLFSASGGGGSLLDEQQNQTLERLLASRVTMDQLLLGKWIYLTVLGTFQTTIMFLWGQVAFGVELFKHWDGFFVMTLITAGAAASFGLLLATASRTRGQLNSLSVVSILTMSALGGSMVPRYLMSDTLQGIGRWTFNAWALDGYNKVFWRDAPLSGLGTELSVLLASGFVFLMLARILAIRWERA